MPRALFDGRRWCYFDIRAREGLFDRAKNFGREGKEFYRIIEGDFDDGDLSAIEVLLLAKVIIRRDEHIVSPIDQSHETPVFHAAPPLCGHRGHLVAGQSGPQLPWNVLVKNDALHGPAAKIPSRLGALPSGNPRGTPRAIRPGRHSPAGFAREPASPQKQASLPALRGPNVQGCGPKPSYVFT